MSGSTRSGGAEALHKGDGPGGRMGRGSMTTEGGVGACVMVLSFALVRGIVGLAWVNGPRGYSYCCPILDSAPQHVGWLLFLQRW